MRALKTCFAAIYHTNVLLLGGQASFFSSSLLSKPVWTYRVVPCSYEERLNCLVLQEEFLPLMKDMKQSITLLTAAAKGNAFLPIDRKSVV